MNQRFFIILFFLAIHFAHAQKMQKNDLIEKDWCTDNSSRNFYKSDTIKLYHIIDTLNERQKLNKQYRELDFNKNKNITQLKFYQHKKLDVTDVDVESWINSHKVGKWKWEYDNESQILSLIFNNKLFSAFKIESVSFEELKWNYEDFKGQPQKDIYHFKIVILSRIK